MPACVLVSRVVVHVCAGCWLLAAAHRGAVVCVLALWLQVTEQMLTALSFLRREMLGVQDGYELPEPQLPAKTTSQAAIDAACAAAAKKAAAEQAEAEADAAS